MWPSTISICCYRPRHTLPRVVVESSNPFARSSRLPPKRSPSFSGPRKSPTAAGIRTKGLGVRNRNVTANRSPNGLFSPKLGAWSIYSTSFSAHAFNGLASLASRKVGIPFAYCSREGNSEPADRAARATEDGDAKLRIVRCELPITSRSRTDSIDAKRRR